MKIVSAAGHDNSEIFQKITIDFIFYIWKNGKKKKLEAESDRRENIKAHSKEKKNINSNGHRLCVRTQLPPLNPLLDLIQFSLNFGAVE